MVHISQFLFEGKPLFRTSFNLKNRTRLNWFPGHMDKGIRQMQKKLKSVDCVIEVHDARVPFTGRNPASFQTVSGLRPHVLVYNKRDLADDSKEKVVIDKHKENGFENVIFTNCKDFKCDGLKQIIPLTEKLIKSSQRYNRSENLDCCLMVIGIPNVGKSSIINALRNRYLLKGKAAAVGGIPGITRSVGEKIKVSDDPLIFVYDTPGILTPNIPSVDDGMKLALCATIPDKEVGILVVADYLLFWMNKNGNFKYVDFLGLDNPSDNISEVLVSFAVENDYMIKGTNFDGRWVMRPNVDIAAVTFVDAFRRGLFGKITLDLEKLCSNISQQTTYVKRTASKR